VERKEHAKSSGRTCGILYFKSSIEAGEAGIIRFMYIKDARFKGQRAWAEVVQSDVGRNFPAS